MRASIRHDRRPGCLPVASARRRRRGDRGAPAPRPARPARPPRPARRAPPRRRPRRSWRRSRGLLAPVSTSASLADWAAATDVTPEHTGQRTGADKALAALAGSTTVIDKTKALLKNEKQLDELTVRQLRKLLLAAAESPGTIPEVVAKRVEAEAQPVEHPGRLHLLPAARRAAAAPSRSPPTTSTTSCSKSRDLDERQRIWTASKEIGRPLKPGLSSWSSCATRWRARWATTRTSRCKVADYGMTVDEMMKLLDDTLATTQAALRRAALLGQEPAGRALQAPGAQADPGALDRQPLGAELARPRRGGQPRSAVQGLVAREHRQERRELLRLARLPASCRRRSGSSSDLYPVPPGVARKKNSPRLGLAHRSRAGRPLADERRGRTSSGSAPRHHELGPHLLLPLVQPARGAVPAARGREPRLSRGDRRAGQAGQPADALPGQGRRHARRARRRTPTGWLLQSALDSIVFLPWSAGTMSHFEHDLYEDRAAARRVAGASGGTTSPSSRASTPPGGRDPRAVRRLHQDPHQRRRRRSTTTTRWRR